MPVYKRSYRSYSGRLTPEWSRLLIVTRQGIAAAWRSRIMNVLFVACLVPPLVAGATVYLLNSAAARAALGGLPEFRNFSIDGFYFLRLFEVQCWLALVLSAWVGPRLMSPDLTNNGLSLLLSRPLSRFGYLAGKLLVMVTLLSAVTWVPALLLFLLQAQMAENWLRPHWFIGPGLVLGGLLWIGFLSLLSFAISAWVKWRVVSIGLVFGLVLVPAGLGEMTNQIVTTRWGSLLSIPRLTAIVWSYLLRVPRLRFDRAYDVPPAAAVAALLAMTALCLLTLHARIRGREVVRG